MARELAEDKAARLVRERRVRFDPRSSRYRAMAEVRGDHGDYTVTRDERDVWTCNCFAGRHSCSHIRAAQWIYLSVFEALRER